ncbi:phospholipase/carboxylesterase [Sanguibacter antarcticus]|uniref:Phospholipase/carboxylesterase n=2 Tax=Sanguibacter antarcticus TaxID=372484 RepID=A0A2A9E2E0_9MICO|nr:phospholipase/carboxylesterase [Sanguibacter antarcticus]
MWSRDPAPGDPLLVLLHGYGSNEADLMTLAPELPTSMTTVALRAPLPAQAGFAWMPIVDPGFPDPAQAQAAASTILAWLDEHVDASTPVALLGFSQGGLMVTELLRTAPTRFVAGVVLSGFVVDAARPDDAALAHAAPPVFFGRGTLDPVIDTAAFERARTFLAAHTTLTDRAYPGLGHGITMDEIADVSRFLESSLPG